MNRIIAEAIQNMRRLSFTYNGKPRIVEPQCYGIGERGTELLRAYQARGDGHPERLFDASKIENLIALDQHFTKPGPNYRKNDSAMKTIFAQL